MPDEHEPDVTGEIEREYEAATAGIVARPAVLDIDTADDELDPGAATGDAADGDDDAVELPDGEPVDPSL